MTFCNDATSIVPFAHVRESFVKQLVQILVYGDDLRKRPLSAPEEIRLLRRDYRLIHNLKHIPIQDSFKTDFFLPIARSAL